MQKLKDAADKETRQDKERIAQITAEMNEAERRVAESTDALQRIETDLAQRTETIAQLHSNVEKLSAQLAVEEQEKDQLALKVYLSVSTSFVKFPLGCRTWQRVEPNNVSH